MREARVMRTATHGVLLVPKDDPRRALLVKIAGTFIQQPTLRLTLPQAQRLWNIDAQTCNEHLSELVSARFLEVRNRQYQLTHETDVW
jgi:predicted transcriptional regulator